MAKILIENTRPHDIVLHVKTAEGVETVRVPSARQNELDRKILDNGVVEIDDSFLKLAMKKPVVKIYFDQRWLQKKKAETKKPAPPVAGDPDAGDDGNPFAGGSKTPAVAK